MWDNVIAEKASFTSSLEKKNFIKILPFFTKDLTKFMPNIPNKPKYA